MQRRSARSQALRQRARNEAARVARNTSRFANDFDNEMRSLSLKVCISCNRRRQNSDIAAQTNICGRCERTDNPLFTTANGMNFGEIPDALRDLSMIEEILIARVHPVVSVYKIRGQQTGYSGHVMNFVQHVEQVATILPNDIRTLNTVILLNRETPSGLTQFRVRAARVRRALIWLRANNQYYSDIQINEEILAELPADGDVSALIPRIAAREEAAENANEPMNNVIVGSCYPNIPAVNVNEVIAQNINRIQPRQPQERIEIGDWPDLSQRPLDEFRTEGLICRAFPTLFPYGRGDLRAPRLEKIPERKYFQYLMEYKDGRFANHSRFPYYAYNSLARWDALNCGSVYVRKHGMEGVCAEDIAEIIADPDHDLAASIMYYGASLRGTRMFWKQRAAELQQMCRQLGTPTIFFTLSAADYHWPDLFRLLSPQREPSSLAERERRELMHQNPMIVAWFFDLRTNVFMKKVMCKYFNVKDFWFRYEWQHRGSPHVHGLLWLDDAPDCSHDIEAIEEEDRANIIEYFDAIVSACIGTTYVVPIQGNPCRQRYTDLTQLQKETDLDRLLSAIQRHTRCSDSCMRRNRRTRRMQCRYGFPIQEEAQSCLRREAGSWKFIPRRNDTLLQRHNPFVSQVWRGNTDFSAITSKDAVMRYISKYASKGEYASAAYSDVLRQVVSRNQPDSPAATVVRQLLVSSVAERNYSAQEVMHLLMGWPLYHASRTFVILPVREDWQRLETGANSRSIVNRYPCREDTLDDVSLFDYAKKYRIERNSSRLRMKECIVRVIPYLKLTEDDVANEEYYKLQCKLHIPWRNSFENILPDGSSWRDLYLAHLENIDDSDPFEAEFPQQPEEIEFEEPEDDIIIRDPAMAASRLRPGSQEQDVLGQRVLDEAYQWRTMTSEIVVSHGITEEGVYEFLRAFRSAPFVSDRAREFLLTEDQMSPEQQAVMEICRRQIASPDECIKRCIVQGKAGTGKSALIRALCSYLDEQQGARSYAVLAPTGAAAMNINGSTIHSALRMPTSGSLMPLTGENIRSFQLQYKDLNTVIIDEYSMIGLRMLHKIHSRLCEIRGISEEPFGGFNVYLFGDLRQLPPVRDLPIYTEPTDDYSRYGLHLVNSFEQKIVLTTVHRQGDDQERFKQCLDRLATGDVTRNDWDLLMTRRISIAPANMATFRDSTHLYPTNDQVREHNQRVLASFRNRPIALIEAQHNNATARQGSDAMAGGLSRRLLLSVGSRVILRKNICVEKGLVNGATGFVFDIVYRDGQGPPSLPFMILIQFDKYPGPYLVNQLFPLQPAVTTWKEHSVDCQRRQFPINLAYALTIHKAQGLTLDKVTANIGRREMSAGLTYVALSRVRRLEDLLLDGFDFSRIAAIGRNPQVVMRENFLRTIE